MFCLYLVLGLITSIYDVVDECSRLVVIIIPYFYVQLYIVIELINLFKD